ncbi:aldo/keto reductase [Spirochaetia bacterium]|nr:aldo/keto reductase [Spirochaetia bacterium]
MQYRIDKKSGNSLSVLGFGCMRFPRKSGIPVSGSQNYASIDYKKSEALVLEAVQRGVNYFDTAYLYPGSEETTGSILANAKIRGKVFIATKMPLLFCKQGADLEKFFQKSLERLKTKYVDYYLLHMITDSNQWEQFKKWGVESWIAEKKKSGQIKQIGFSFHGSQPDFLQVLGDYDWEFCQIQYNYSDPNFQAGVTGLKKAAETMPVIIMEPLLGGKLATGLPADAGQAFKKANPDLSPAQWGLKWIWDQSEPTVVLSGMNTPEQLAENLTVADSAVPGMLTRAEHELFDQVRGIFSASYKIHCTGCNYCMPCPQGVNIPACFSAYNTSYTMGFNIGIQQFITSIGITSEKTSSPHLCVKCGKCETHCPQHLPIMQNLELVRHRLEPFWVRWGGGIARTFLKSGRKH